MYGGVWVRFSRRGVDVAENSSEVGFLYEDPGRHAQPHTNHKPVFAELANIAVSFLISFLEVEVVYKV